MTDKQIIDGVDVSECECFYINDSHPERKECLDLYYQDLCNDNPNCYYKQLKRKEQECNKLYIQLKADEKYHKEEENTLRKIIKSKEKRNIELYKENNQLKQTLIEIKDMCSEIDCESLMENSWCGNTDFKMGCCEKFFKRKILQVIRESEIEYES